jgi:phosphopantetheinyl transferase (holo-ACP synthase)
MKNIIQSRVETVSINDVRKNAGFIKTRYFAKTELQELQNEHLQTLAGFYAVKCALKKLINDIYPEFQIEERQIIITHNKTGAPRVKTIKPMQKADTERIYISITHTSDNAYGFAAISRMDS